MTNPPPHTHLKQMPHQEEEGEYATNNNNTMDEQAEGETTTTSSSSSNPPLPPLDTYERLLDLGTGLFYYRKAGTQETTWDTPLPSYVTKMAPVPLNAILGITTVRQAHPARVAVEKRRRDRIMRSSIVAQLVEARQAAAAQRKQEEAAYERDRANAKDKEEASKRQREEEEAARRLELQRLAALIRTRKRAERREAALRHAIQMARQEMEEHCKDKIVRARLRREVEKQALLAYNSSSQDVTSSNGRKNVWERIMISKWWWGNKPHALREVEDVMLAKTIQDLVHKAEDEARAKFNVQCQRVRHVQRAWRRLRAAQCFQQWRQRAGEEARHRQVQAYQRALQRQQEYEAGIVKLIWAQGKVDEWRQEWDDRQQFAFFLHRQTGEMRLTMPSVEEFMPVGYVAPQPLDEATLRLLAAGPPPSLVTSRARPPAFLRSRSKGRGPTWTTLLAGSVVAATAAGGKEEEDEEEDAVWWDEGVEDD